MLILTDDESKQWCSDRGLALKAEPYWRDISIGNCLRFNTQRKESVVCAWVRGVVGSVDFPEGIVWLRDWPLYRPDEMAVVTRFRSSIDERRNLIVAPGHVFDAHEVADCIGLFNLCVQYYWDALLFVPVSGLVIFNSHDGVQYTSALSEELWLELTTWITGYDLAQF